MEGKSEQVNLLKQIYQISGNNPLNEEESKEKAQCLEEILGQLNMNIEELLYCDPAQQ